MQNTLNGLLNFDPTITIMKYEMNGDFYGLHLKMVDRTTRKYQRILSMTNLSLELYELINALLLIST